MEELGVVGLLILLTNGFITYKGLSETIFFNKYSFIVEKILIYKDYKRLISSAFLHVNWMHFLFNMITLYCFSAGLENVFGAVFFIFLYVGSLIGGNLFSLYIHRHHPDYSAVGASGAISGIVFASIALFPGMELGLLMLPLYIPAWAFGLAYVLYSIYGIKSQRDNIGHEAHLGGGVVGLAIAVITYPKSLAINYLPILLILIPSLIFLYVIFFRPQVFFSHKFEKNGGYRDIDEIFYTEKQNKELALNKLLDKINTHGLDSLTDDEQETLRKLSK